MKHSGLIVAALLFYASIAAIGISYLRKAQVDVYYSYNTNNH